MRVTRERPVVAHVNYTFFHSTQSFIYHYLVALRRFRAICLTRTPETSSIAGQRPAALADDLYAYEPRRGSRSALWSGGVALRRTLTRLSPRVAEPVLASVDRRLTPRLRPDTDARAYLDWAEAIMRRREAQIIHAYFCPVGWRALELRRRLGVPLVVTSLGDDIAPTLPPWWQWWLRRDSEEPDYPSRLRELFDEGELFLAEGPHLREQLIAYGCPPAKVRLQRMAVPLERLPFRPRHPPEDRPPVILFAGRFCEQKGVLYALEAVNELRREGRELEFRLVGDETMTDGRYAARVYSYIRGEGLRDCVRLLGWQSNDRYVREMQNADIFLHPSVVDADGRGEGGAPTTILEAQALGMPIVSTLHCDIPYVTRPGQSALLVPERDSAALADALRTLLDHPERWAEMGRAGRRHVEQNHDISREAPRLEGHYLSLTR